MKTLRFAILGLILAAMCPLARATWVLRNQQGGVGGNASTPAFTNALTPGSLIIVFVYAGPAPSTPTDTATNTYHDCGAGAVPLTSGWNFLSIFYTINSHSTASNVVTSTSGAQVVAWEYTGNASSSVVETYGSNPSQTSGGSGQNYVMSASSLSTSNANDFVVGAILTAGSPTGITPLTGFSILFNGTGNSYMQGGVFASGTIPVTANGPGSTAYGGIAVAFKAAATPAVVNPPHAGIIRSSGKALPAPFYVAYGIYSPVVTTVPANGLGLTPVMGWNSWNNSCGTPTQTCIEANAASMSSNGMLAAGYTYISLDDQWQTTARNADGSIAYNATEFPAGIAAVATYVHGLGEKFGIYTSPGPTTCAGYMGSFGYEQQDAATFASWGVDYLKYDWCSASTEFDNAISKWGAPTVSLYVFQYMAQALQATGRPIYLAINPWNAGPTGCQYAQEGVNAVRFGADASGTWASVLALAFGAQGTASCAGPGYFNDPDTLMVGNGITDQQGKTEFSIFAIRAFPLIEGADLTTLTGSSITTLTNTDVIGVDQDPLGIQGTMISSTTCGSATCQVWAKPLNGTNTCAIGMYNLDSAAHNITATFSAIAAVYSQCGSGPYTTTRDLEAHSSLGTLTTSYTASSVPAYGVAMIKVAP